jgi:hypothetical protein
MKKTFLFATILSLACVAGAAPGIRYDAKTWRSVQTFDVQTLSHSMPAHVRQLVAVKFHFRGKDIHHLKPNWYECSIWQTLPGKRGKFADVRVMIAKKDLKAFKSIPVESTAPESVLYGRIEYDVRANFYFLRLIGRSVTVDAAGNANISW